MCQLYDKNGDRSGTGAKPVKTASFFIKIGFSFVKNSLQSRLRPGCTHHGDPGAGEVQTRVCVRSLRGCVDVYPPCWRCFYALFWHLFCRWLFFWLQTESMEKPFRIHTLLLTLTAFIAEQVKMRMPTLFLPLNPLFALHHKEFNFDSSEDLFCNFLSTYSPLRDDPRM